MEIRKDYNAHEVEEKWLNLWKDEMYYFDWNSEKPHYIIDTPPPYPTGSFHIGHALNWCIIDFIARYKRMNGYEVMFPQGWDCHGLPTEVKVEESYGIKKGDVPREKFRELCVKFTEQNIAKMRETARRMGYSIDWSKEYITMYPEYYSKTQLSFVRMYKKGLIYRDYHPVVFCPRCETTIALAEIEYRQDRTRLNYIKFDDDVIIATTRPELIPACVAIAIHPDDERNKHLVGKRVRVPTTDYYAEVIADEEVDPEFGTGVVMICTFGDRQDVKWWKKHKLELRNIVGRDGRLNEKAGKYAGMTIPEAREAILEDLKEEGRLLKQVEIDHNVGVCWRCKTPVEIIPAEQWFVKVEKEKILEAARKIKWVPEHMYSRLESWVQSMEWDWVISRQRIFATPIPAWYCKNCGEVVVAKEEWLPVDPTAVQPPEPCPKCGSTEFRGETDVLDTWMDSSITPLMICGWPELREYPTHLRPQGHDIIRTWAFYTILRSLALEDQIPWYEIVINGMVFGEDGRKMSKSLGNVIVPEEVVEKYGVDALRQWAASGVIGDDIIFSWKDVVAASRFQQKFWSITRFTLMHIANYKPSEEDRQYLRSTDRWILSKLNRLVGEVRKHMDSYRFDEAIKAIRTFTWYEYADNYLEIVKNRLYSGSEEEKRAAKFVLHYALDVLTRLLAPVTPFLAEECWSHFKEGSVHLQSYPVVEEEFLDEKAEKAGEEIKEIVAAVRKFKHDKGLALNAPLKRLIVYSKLDGLDVRDVAGATNSEVEVVEEMPEVRERVVALKPKFAVIGPMFRDKAKKLIKAVEGLSEEEKERLLREGAIEITLDGQNVEVRAEWFDAVTEKSIEGREVEMLETASSVIFVEI
ncbi:MULTISPECIES: valine--tRNA ligase [unclassified Archaeoglobus]|jgi:valyl-tRNA synthetase|uniref:valine--tRNA ligase n=1 Tax=unclassified Archaeoglobus TaxID=2643606 RepID=UPI0025BEC3E2|nr:MULTISPECIES: valine--tRNA ligase [unclassified Archaeoglobus]